MLVSIVLKQALKVYLLLKCQEKILNSSLFTFVGHIHSEAPFCIFTVFIFIVKKVIFIL